MKQVGSKIDCASLIPTATSHIFVWPVRVYYEDTDAGGLVYHSRYLHFLERARTEWLRHLGFEQDTLAHRDQILFAVHHIEINFLRPAQFNNQLEVHSQITALRRVSINFLQNIHLATNATHLIKAQVQIACIDTIRHRPIPIPPTLMQAIRHEL